MEAVDGHSEISNDNIASRIFRSIENIFRSKERNEAIHIVTRKSVLQVSMHDIVIVKVFDS
jgi:hypothetical protein